MKPWAIVGIAIALLAVGFGTGWHAKGVSVLAAQAKPLQHQVTAITKSVNEQVAKQQQQMTDQQTASAALYAQQAVLRTSGDSIRLEIVHAVFTPPTDPDQCVDPVASPEFEQLYNRAAGDAASGAAAAAENTR